MLIVNNTSTAEEELLQRLQESDQKRGIPPNIIGLRQKLALKAKREPKFKFYSLFSLICRSDVLETAWNLVARNRGAPGVDNISIEDIEQQEGGPLVLINKLQVELQNKQYKPLAVKRVYIEKGDGITMRPLGIPTVRDRLVQMAVVLILEPIFEADFLNCSYGFRPGIG